MNGVDVGWMEWMVDKWWMNGMDGGWIENK